MVLSVCIPYDTNTHGVPGLVLLIASEMEEKKNNKNNKNMDNPQFMKIYSSPKNCDDKSTKQHIGEFII